MSPVAMITAATAGGGGNIAISKVLVFYQRFKFRLVPDNFGGDLSSQLERCDLATITMQLIGGADLFLLRF